MNIDTKANIGDIVYYLKPIRRMNCPICAGSGKIRLGSMVELNLESQEAFVESVGEQLIRNLSECVEGKTKEYDCPECGGKGTIKVAGQTKYEVGEGIVTAIEAMMNEDRQSRIIYRVNDPTDDKNYNRTLTNEKLYVDRESAEKQCRFMNLERRLVHLNSVLIPRSFVATIPCNVKLMKRLNEWRIQRKFTTEIYVDENLNLFDGYTAYLVYRMLGIETIPVVIWPDDMRN